MIWFVALKELDRRAFQYGLLRLLKNPNRFDNETQQAWPPNAEEFKALCQYRAEDFGLSSVETAYHEARRALNREVFRWSHVTVYLAAVAVGYEMLTMNSQAASVSFNSHYQTLLARFMHGEALGEAPMKGIADPSPSIQSNVDVAKRHLAECYRILAGGAKQVRHETV